MAMVIYESHSQSHCDSGRLMIPPSTWDKAGLDFCVLLKLGAGLCQEMISAHSIGVVRALLVVSARHDLRVLSAQRPVLLR